MMRILLTADPVLPVPPATYGGIERIVDALIRQYRAGGHTVGLVAHPASTAAADRVFPWPADRPEGTSATVRNALALNRAVKAFAPDVVHSFSRLAYLTPLLLRRLPKVMSYQRHTGGRQIRFAAKLARQSLHFTGCSEFICQMGRRAGGEWTAIPNFVEIERYPFVAAVPPDAPLVFLSRIESIKGPDLAIAIARAAGRRLILAGNRPQHGAEAAFFAAHIEPHLGRDGIEWTGEIADAAKAELLGRAAALLVPIQWDEPFGIVFAEALACGTPILTCARGATPEVVEPGRTGLFVHDVHDGVEAVRRIGSLERKACREAAELRFNATGCAQRYLDLLHEAAIGAGGTQPTR